MRQILARSMPAWAGRATLMVARYSGTEPGGAANNSWESQAVPQEGMGIEGSRHAYSSRTPGISACRPGS